MAAVERRWLDFYEFRPSILRVRGAAIPVRAAEVVVVVHKGLSIVRAAGPYDAAVSLAVDRTGALGRADQNVLDAERLEWFRTHPSQTIRIRCAVVIRAAFAH